MAKRAGKTARTPSFFNSRLTLTVLILAAGLALLLILKSVIELLPAEAATNPFLGAWLRVWVFAILAVVAFVIVRVRDEEARGNLVAMLVGLCFAGIVMLGLKNTSYGLNGIGGDQGLQTAQVTKFAELPGAVDFAYKDLPPFYPPTYFFALGKTAAVLDIEPYRMLKYGLIAVVFVLPLLVRWFWSWVQPHALSLAAVLSLLLFQDWYKPYEWLALVLFIPWWLHFVDGVGAKDGSKRAWILLGGLIGGLLFSTYYYWFFIGGVALLIRWLVRKHEWGDANDESRHSWQLRFLVLASAALFSLPFWGPLVWSMWKSGGWDSLQNRYFLAEFNTLHFPFLEFSITGLILLAGLVYLLQTFRRNRLAFGLLVLLAAAYVWQLLGYVAFLTDIPLLTFKARDFVLVVLALAAAFGAAELVQNVRKAARSRERWETLVVAGAVVVALFTGQLAAAGFAEHPLLHAAVETTYPRILISDYTAAVSGQFAGHIVLGDGGTKDISIYLPVFQFLSWAAVYSHPAAEYYERLDFLQELSRVQDPGWFAAALMNNRYDRVDEIILLPVEGGFLFGYLPENFPAPSETDHLFFPDGLFDPMYFSRTQLGEFVLFNPLYANDPLLNLPAPAVYDVSTVIAGIGDGDDLYQFMQRFDGHLSFPGQEDYSVLLSEVFGP